jgi:hypothetical protein
LAILVNPVARKASSRTGLSKALKELAVVIHSIRDSNDGSEMSERGGFRS